MKLYQRAIDRRRRGGRGLAGAEGTGHSTLPGFLLRGISRGPFSSSAMVRINVAVPALPGRAAEGLVTADEIRNEPDDEPREGHGAPSEPQAKSTRAELPPMITTVPRAPAPCPP